jgi:2-(1,2-epoxy-1,2-dihydrophenyl)acetyl-CoA isomerase
MSVHREPGREDLPLSTETVLLDINGPVATLSINRPDARNSLLRGMGGQIYSLLRRVAENGDVRILVFRGVGPDFCPGADLKAKAPETQTAPEPDLDAYHVTALLHEMPQVTIAAIRGACAGAGLGWACACDVRVCDETAKINTAFLDAGVAGDMGVPWTMPKLIGAGRARDLMYFPRKVTAEEALSIGLVQRLWDSTRFERELEELSQRLARSAPLALAAMKANFIDAERLDLKNFIALEAERHIRLLETEDRKEAFKAFADKRPPRFHGR